MSEPHVIVVGGGLAGLAAGCYARASGFRTTIVEHNLALGGVCAAWKRDPYVVDGCIQWLTGGVFEKLYRELGVIPRVPLRTIDQFLTLVDMKDDSRVLVSRDLEGLAQSLAHIAPEDAAEIRRMVDGARKVVSLDPGVDRPPELSTRREHLMQLFGMRQQLSTLVHFRKPMSIWSEEHLKNPRLRRLLSRLLPPEAPAFFLLMMLGYLERGYLSRPVGGSGAFVEAIADTYRRAGGETILNATVDEILVQRDRAVGVRLADGSILESDLVVSTSSAPETVLRLLGGRYGASEVRERLETWKLFQPIALVSFGVASSLAGIPRSFMLEGQVPFVVGGFANDCLHARIYDSEDGFAPEGHAVVQATVATTYEHWARTGSRYNAEKEALAARVIDRLEAFVPGVSRSVRMTDVATPMTFWRAARSWRGAFEGWMPSAEGSFDHISKVLPGLSAFYMAGQWMEPGGGIPMAVMSGRQVVQLMCEDHRREFVSSVGRVAAA